MTETELTRCEQGLLRLMLRAGKTGAVLFGTAIAIVMSVLFTWGFGTLLIEAEDRHHLQTSMLLALLVAGVVGPVILWTVFGLLHRLDTQSRQLRALATTDSLTGALNRRGFHEAARQRMSGPVHHAPALLAGVVDLDRFKSLNDRHGHAMGDQALQQLVRQLHDTLGSEALLGRAGGDEFVFLCSGDEASLDALQQRIDRQCTDIHVSDDIRLSASIGMVRRQPDETLDELLMRADAQTYRIKHSRGHSRQAA